MNKVAYVDHKTEFNRLILAERYEFTLTKAWNKLSYSNNAYINAHDIMRFFEENNNKLSFNDAKLLVRLITQRKDQLISRIDLEKYLLPQTNQTLSDRLK